MSIEEKKQALSRGGNVKPERVSPLPQPKAEKPDTSIFRGKENLSMGEALWKLKRAPSQIPGAGGAMFSPKEKTEILKDWEKKYGSFLERNKDIPRIFKDLGKAKAKAPTSAEKQKIDRQIRYLKRELTGK